MYRKQTLLTIRCRATRTPSRYSFVGPSDFADVLGFPYDSPVSFRIIASKDTGLVIELLEEGTVTRTKTYSFKEGLELTAEGVIYFSRYPSAGSSDSPVVGFASGGYALYLNRENALVVLQSGSGAGVVGIFPMAIYGKFMSIFPRQNKEL